MTIPYQNSESIDAVLAPLRAELAERVREALAKFAYSGDAVGAMVTEARMPNLTENEQTALLARPGPVAPNA